MSTDRPQAASPDPPAASFAEAAFRSHRAALQRFLMRRLHHNENAQDLAQEVYLRLLRVEDADLIRHPLAFLYRLALNVAFEFRLRKQRDPVRFDSETAEELEQHAQYVDATPDASEQLCTEEELRRLLAPLPPMVRAVLVLRKRDGMSNQEIAGELGISIHTVKKYLCQAVAHCRAAVEGREDELT